MMKIILFLWVAQILAAYAPVVAQNVNEALQGVYATSEQIKMAELNLKIAKISKTEAMTGFVPTLSAKQTFGNQSNAVNGVTTASGIESNSTTVTMSQNIFNGYNTVGMIKYAGYNVDSEQGELRKMKSQIMYRFVKNVIELKRLQQMRDLESQKLSFWTSKIGTIKNIESKGQASKLDVTNAELTKGHIEFSILNVDQKIQEAVSELSLLTHAGVQVYDLPDIDIDKILQQKDAIIGQIENAPDLAIQKSKNLIAHEGVLQARRKLLPTADLSLQYQKQAGSVFLGGNTYETRGLYLNVNVPMFNGGSEYTSIRKQKTNQLHAQYQYTLTKNEMLQNLHSFFDVLSFEYKKYNLLCRSLESMNQVLAYYTADPKSHHFSSLEIADKEIERLEYLRDINDITASLYLTYLSILVTTGATEYV